MHTSPLLRRTVRLVTLCVLALLLVGPAVSAAPTIDRPAVATPGDSLATPGPAARLLPNRQTWPTGPFSTTGPLTTIPTSPGLHDTHTVTSTADSGSGSLRQALADASPGDTIGFSLTYPVTITLTSGELAITKSLTLLGPGAENLAVSGNGASRVFAIGGAGTTAALSGLTVAYAYGSYLEYGGGIYNAGTLTVTHATFSGNWAGNGGGIYNAGILTVTHTTFSGNRAGYDGGGIYNNGTLMVTHATFSGNEAVGLGGGGGIFNYGVVVLTNTTFSGNSAYSYGGGIDNWSGTLTVAHATFSGNEAAYFGGGIFNLGILHLRSAIIANSPYGGDCFNVGTIGQNVANLIEDGSCSPLYSGDPNLGPLGDYGGDTWTHPLIFPSLAIDHGDPATCPAADQRGYPRHGPCDIGAFEYDWCAPVDGAGFSWRPITPTGGEAVTFTGTVAAGHEPITYTWKLDVGSWQEGRVVTHTYDLSGTYVVVMTATNCATATATAVHTLTVACEEVSILSVTTDISDCAVTFGADLGGAPPFTYLWDFGPFGTSTATNPLVDFQTSGTYSGTLSVWNCGNPEPDMRSFTVEVACVRWYWVYLPVILRNWP